MNDKVSTWDRLFPLCQLIIMFGCVGLGALAVLEIKSNLPDKQVEIVYDINDPFSEQKVRDYLKQLHVKYPDVAIAQMKLESASGTSKIFREGNNLFGMKLAQRRPTTALGERNNHAYYSHWRSSCIDYALWQSYVSNAENLESESEWLNYVGQVYAEDNSYRKKLIVIKDSFKSNKI